MDDYKCEEYHLRRLIDRSINRLGEKYGDFLEKKFSDEKQLDRFLSLISTEKESFFSDPIERQFKADFHNSQTLYNDLIRLEEQFNEKWEENFKNLKMPIWVSRHPLLKEKWTERWKEVILPAFDINKSYLLYNTTEDNDQGSIESGLNERELNQINESRDLDRSRPISEQLKPYSSDQKDENLVERSNILGNVLNKIAKDVEEGVPKEPPRHFPNRPLSTYDHPEVQGRFFPEELKRAIYLNNKDPDFYNPDFFATYFGISRKQILRTLKSISVPLVDHDKKELIRILRFIEINHN